MVTVACREKPEDSGVEIRFIDFDWAGRDGVTQYPLFMNHADISWPQDATEGMPLQQAHDTELLRRLLDAGRA